MPFEKVLAGQQLQIHHQEWNTLMDMAKVHKGVTAGGGIRGQGPVRRGTSLLENKTGQTLGEFSVVGLKDPVISPADSLEEFRANVAITGVVPTADHVGRFAVLAEPIAADDIGDAYVSGICPVQINMLSEDHTYADIKAGDCTQLESCTSGTARILAVQPGTGTKWAYIRIGGGGGGGGSTYPECTILCDIEIPAGSLAEIVSENRYANTVFVRQPSADDLSIAQLLYVPLLVPADTPGKGYKDWGDKITLLCDEELTVGDIIGSRANSWKARKGTVGLEVTGIITGQVAYVKMLTFGDVRTSNPTASIAAPGGAGRQATGLAVLGSDNRAASVMLKDAGSRYTIGKAVTFSGGGSGTQATGETVCAGAVDRFVIRVGGFYGVDGEAETPAISFPDAPDGAENPVCTPVMTDGVLTAIDFDRHSSPAYDLRGYGFVLPPEVIIAAPTGGVTNGVQAVATAVLA